MAKTKRAQQAPRSTEFPDAAPWSALGAKFAETLGARLGLGKSAAEIGAKFANREWIETRVRSAPGIALSLLEIVIEAGGSIDREVLQAIARDRLKLAPAEFEAAVVALQDNALAFTLVMHSPWDEPIAELAVVDNAAEHIAALVRGMTLPAPPAETVSVGPGTVLRDRVALLASVAHLPVRYTKANRANLTSCKKLAAVAGQDEDALAEILDRAIALGMLGANGALLAPRIEPLRELARGTRAWAPTPLAEIALRWAPDDRWIAREALQRAMASQLSRHPTMPPFGLAMLQQAAAAIDSAGLLVLEQGGHQFVRRGTPSVGSGGGDGHVTPSFEVMLGPAADPELTLVVALASEPVRFDRVLTRKLTPASIAAALAAGVHEDEIVDALGRVGRHGLPDNVRAMVADWARTARVVRLRKVWALEASTAEAAELAARALGEQVVARPSATVLLIDGSLATPETSLAKSGLKVAGAPASLATQAIDRPAPPRDSPPPPWLEAIAPPDLRARALDRTGLSPGERPFTPSDAVLALAANESGLRRAFLEIVAKLWAAATQEYGAWAQRLDEDARDAALEHAMLRPLEFLYWLVLVPRLRTKRLAAARASADLAAMPAKRVDHSDLSGDGAHAIRGLANPEIAALMEEHADFGPPLESPAPSPPRPGGRPAPRDLAPQPREELARAIEDAIGAKRALWLRVASKSQGDRVVALVPERILQRGADITLLGTDVESGDGRSFPLANVLALRAHDRAS